jgi:ATP-binding cassette subfamily B protein
MTLAMMMAICLFSVICLRAILEYFSRIRFSYLGNMVTSQVRVDLFNSIQQLSPSFIAQNKSGDLLIRTISDVNMLRDVAVTAILPLGASMIVFLAMSGLMLYLNYWLFLVSFAIAPVVIFVTVFQSKKIKSAAKKQRKQEGFLAGTITEAIQGSRTIQALSLETFMGERFGQQDLKGLDDAVKGTRLSAGLERKVDFLIGIALAIGLAAGTYAVINEQMSAGDLVVYLTYLKRSFTPFQDFAKYTGRLAKASAAAERVFSVIDHVPDVINSQNALVAPEFSGRITFQNVFAGINSANPVLLNLNLEILPGERIAVVGKSGVGKSTFISLIPRLIDPSSGTVKIDGHNIRNLQISTLRSQISILQQEPLLFSTTIKENISLGAITPPMDDEIVIAAKLANADEFIRTLKEGYNTIVSERAGELSAGQRQRLAFARAAIRQSKILIVDEPTTGLDVFNSAQVESALLNLAKGKTMIVVTHDMNLARKMDRILWLGADGYFELGSHFELLQMGGGYSKLQ